MITLDTSALVALLDRRDPDHRRVRRVLVARYAGLPLGVADAAVIACAERSGRRVLTLDDDFRVVAKEGRIEVVGAEVS